MSTSENLSNGQPSTLLISIPVENEKRGAGRTISIQVLQYKRLAAGPISQLTISLRDTKGKRLPFEYISDLTHTKWLMRVALGASENAIGRLWPTLVTLKGSIEAGRKTSFTLSSCLMGSTKEKKFTPSEGIRSLKFEELRDVDISHAVSRRLHSLAFTGDKWVAFADPVQQTGWFIDLQIASPYVVTGKEHKLRKVINSGTRLCSFIPETRNIIVSKAPDQSYVLKTGDGKRGSLKMVS